jgi:ADP-heptose:LPS heptosyltransferase
MQNNDAALVLLPSNFGDVLLTLPALMHLLDDHPSIDAVVSQQTSAFVHALPFVRAVYPYDKRLTIEEKTKFFFEKRGKYKTFIDFRHTFAAWAVGARFSSPVVRDEWKGHKAEGYAHLVAQTFGRKNIPSLYLTKERKFFQLRSELNSAICGKAVFVVPSSRSDLKIYPAEMFAAFLGQLAGMHQVVLIGGAEDIGVSMRLRALLPDSLSVVDLTGKTTFGDVFVLLQRHALCMVTGDTAPMHAASFLNIPTLALFGPTDPVRYGPYAEGSAVIRAQVSCAGCMASVCPKKQRCMATIDPKDVYSAFQNVMPSFKCDESFKYVSSKVVELPKRFR